LLILGIETSCDDASAAVLKVPSEVLSSVTSSQTGIHLPYWGIVPELASREHLRLILPVIRQALTDAGATLEAIRAVAVTMGPGLVGSLLVGLSCAKAIAYARGIPLVPVNHLEGHIASVFLTHPEIPLPALVLIVSGGHTSLLRMEAWGQYRLLGKTRDDAAGEALDKVSKLLRLGYPGGPAIEKLSAGSDAGAYRFMKPKISDGGNDFSFSGLKTQALRYFEAMGLVPDWSPGEAPAEVLNLAASFQKGVIEALYAPTIRVAAETGVQSVLVCGGVSCNRLLRERFAGGARRKGLGIYFPEPRYSTDNAAMIAWAGFRRLSRGGAPALAINADANLRIGE
jgi:N6-L-threonylcarbamoyladenine synthase